MLCVLVFSKNAGTYSLKSTLKDKVFENVFMTILFTLTGSPQRNIFLYFFLLELPDQKPNKPTHYLLDYGDF